MTRTLTAWIDGKPVAPKPTDTGFELVSPLDGRTLYRIVESDAATVDQAVTSARAAWQTHRRSTIAQRVAWLEALAKAFEQDAGRITEMIVGTIGKPRRAANFEASRVGAFIRNCIAELLVGRGEVLPLDSAPAGAGHLGFARRVPYGVVAAITPFNAPANLLVQKLAPALATGNAVVVKPHPTGIEVALAFAELAKQAGLPDGLFNVVTGDRAAASALAAHPQTALITLTGGVAAARALAQVAGAKKFCAELGSNAANLVLADANLEDAATKIAAAGFEASGQQCISAQRIIVEQPVFDPFVEAFVAAARKLKVGDPSDPTTDVGTMVSVAAAERVMALVTDAEAKGARIALRPTLNGAWLSPGIIVAAPDSARVLREEAFGPIVVVQAARDLDHALAQANDSEFGLQGACFTASLDNALKVADEFDCGSIWINEASRFRLDMYPFGGVKDSGFGREGIRYAMEEYSQLKFVGLRASR
ncbi:MAG: aldehyde dehydrogenase family protein [Proteobacteria bacterium]|nr:aldehyde dehydrogenase family protein [Burkholderiales bacterium]